MWGVGLDGIRIEVERGCASGRICTVVCVGQALPRLCVHGCEREKGAITTIINQSMKRSQHHGHRSDRVVSDSLPVCVCVCFRIDASSCQT